MNDTDLAAPDIYNTDANSDTTDNGFLLSYTQESLWLLEKLSGPNKPVYNEALAFQIDGMLRVEYLSKALNQVVKHHEALRTTFTETANGLRAYVHDHLPDFISIVNLNNLSDHESSRQTQNLINNAYQKPFDLEKGPLLRAIIVLISDSKSVFGLTVHHIVSDGWSLALILNEVHKHYVSYCQMKIPTNYNKPHLQYKDYALKLRQLYKKGAFNEKIEYWKRILNGGPKLLQFPTDRPRPSIQTFKGAAKSVKAPNKILNKLIKLCQKECGSTEYTVLLSAYAILLQRYSGQNTISIGTTVLNRDEIDELSTVGCFVNTAVLKINFDNGMSFRELLNQVAQLSTEIIQYQDVPFTKILDHLEIERDPSHNPVFQTMFTLLGKKKKLDLGPDISCQPYAITKIAAKYDLLIYASKDTDGFEFEAEFNTDLFDKSTIDRFLKHYICLLSQLSNGIDIEISKYQIITDEEKKQILNTWNDTFEKYPDENVIDKIERQAQTTPDAVAVEFRDNFITYSELDMRTNRIANLLIAETASKMGFIGVYMERSIEMVIALLSIVKAGMAYVPIDPEYPADRIKYMIEDSQVTLVITHESLITAAALLDSKVKAVSIDDILLKANDDTRVKRNLLSDSHIYMIYTSGSTGRPKGVINRHVSLANRLYWMQSNYCLNPDDHVLQKTPFSFDVSVWEFFWPLMFGARIVMAEPGGHRDADYLKKLINDKKITIMHFVPSMLGVFLEEDKLSFHCNTLRHVFCSGEALSYRMVKKFHNRLSCKLHNLYGPTEAAIDVSYWQCTVDYPGRIVPIGAPVANTTLYVLDRHMQLQPIGIPGELYIGGVQLAEGYHNRKNLTAETFVQDPYSKVPNARLYRTGDLARLLPDGKIEYLGRIDNQVKLRGFRIELGEIEAVLKEIPFIKDAAVIVRETKTNRMIVAYVVSNDFDSHYAKELLGTKLPSFMIPQTFITIPYLPLSVNGKLDRKALPDPISYQQVSSMRIQPPLTQEGRLLKKIWSDMLEVDQISNDSNFFQLGGDSILSIKIAGKLSESGYHINVQEVFTNPVFGQLVNLLKSKDVNADNNIIKEKPFCLLKKEDVQMLPMSVEEAWPLTMLQSGMIYHSMLYQDSSIYHDIFSYDIQAPLDQEAYEQAIQTVSKIHPQMRSFFDLGTYSEPIQLINSELHIPVGFYDVTMLPIEEQRKAITSWIEEEKSRTFDLERAPLLRFQVHKQSSARFNLIMAFHHVILDGWSVAILIEQIHRIYSGLLNDKPIKIEKEKIPYSNFVNLERKALQDQDQADFWFKLVKHFPTTLLSDLTIRMDKTSSISVDSVERIIPEEFVSILHKVTGKLSLPLKSAFLAIHLHALSSLIGQKQAISGLVVNGRPEISGGDNLVGLFLNTIPFPIDIQNQDWPLFVSKVFSLEQEVLAYRRYPLSEILKQSGREALFDTVFNYTDFHIFNKHDNNEVQITGAQYFEQTNFSVVVHVHHDNFSNKMKLIVVYDSATIDQQLVTTYLDNFIDATKQLVISFEKPVAIKSHNTKDDNHIRMIEEEICGIIAQALGIPKMNIFQNYLELGLDSISAIRIVAKIKRLGLKISIQDLFNYSTIRELIENITFEINTGKKKSRIKPFELVDKTTNNFPPNVIDAYPVTAMQLEMIHHFKSDVAQAIYHDVFTYQLELPFKEQLLRNILEKLIKCHETLRTAFDLSAKPVPLQLIFEKNTPRLCINDISNLSQSEQTFAFDNWFKKQKTKNIDFSIPCLIDFHVHKYSPNMFSLTLSFHHSIIDGWSLSLFIRDLIKIYTQGLNAAEIQVMEPPKLLYRDYVGKEMHSSLDPIAKQFWQNELRNYRVLKMPKPENIITECRWSETKIHISTNKQKKLLSIAKQADTGLKHVMLAGHIALLGILCQRSDVITAIFTNGRLEEEGGEQTIGLFLNFNYFRQNIDNHSWRSLIQQTFKNDRRLIPYRRYPFRNIEIDSNINKITEVIFNYTQFKSYEEIAWYDNSNANAKYRVLKSIRWFEHTHFPLLINIGYDIHQEKLILTLNANGKIFTQSYIEILGKLYDAVYTKMITDENAEIFHPSNKITQLCKHLQEVNN
jgi:amino acid adenylation domain-containing protein